jgi:addiction module HigA family antidote
MVKAPMSITLHPSFAVHPGPWLRTEIIEPHGLSVTVAAQKLHVTRQAMSNLLNGNAGLSAEMPIRFENAFGLRAETLLRMQVAHDLAAARSEEEAVFIGRFAMQSCRSPIPCDATFIYDKQLKLAK